jgi:hydroxyethylthiazole kinase-like uncharacterized protein yjeF
MRRLDQWASREFHLPLIVTMENAGRAIADLVVRRFAPKRREAIVALVGKGANGGAALAGGRHLLQRGYAVSAVTVDVQTKLKDETLKQLQMFRKFGGSAPPFVAERSLPESSLLLDGILGYGLTETSKGLPAQVIQAANDHAADVLAVDLPSGLHPDRGTPSDPTVEATATLALALPKEGLLRPEARAYVGEVYLGDVGFPRPLYDEFGLKPEDLFGPDVLVRLPGP